MTVQQSQTVYWEIILDIKYKKFAVQYNLEVSKLAVDAITAVPLADMDSAENPDFWHVYAN